MARVTTAMKRVGARVLVAVAALLSAVLGFVIPGSFAYAAGMMAFMLLPGVLGSAVGKAIPTEGGVRYGTGRSGDERMEVVIRTMGALAFAAFGYFSQSRDGMMLAVFGALIGNGCALLALMSLLASVFVPHSSTHGVTLEATTLTLDTGDGIKVVGYAELLKIEVDKQRITLVTSTDRHGVAVQGPPERAVELARMITEAKARAASAAQSKDARTKELERASGMSPREWFGRLDAIAAASRSATAYRGGAIDEEHLCGVLADEGADVESRTAAARVLVSSDDPEVRMRVASSVKDISDDRTRVRVELAMRTDTEAAAAEMEALEMEELRKTAGV